MKQYLYQSEDDPYGQNAQVWTLFLNVKKQDYLNVSKCSRLGLQVLGDVILFIVFLYLKLMVKFKSLTSDRKFI